MENQYFILWIVALITTLAAFIAYECFSLTRRKMKELKFMQKLKEIENSHLHEQLLERVKNKIELTQKAENRLRRAEDIVAQSIYQSNNNQRLGNDLKALYKSELSALNNKYPNLTELDLLVITLLGMNLDNVEICNLLHMEKQTLYRRRQLIAQRMGISSLELNEIALQLIKE